MYSDKNRHNFSALLLIVTVFSFALMFLRFFQIMVRGEVNGEDLHNNVERLYTQNDILQANRGTIFDRFGNPIAIDANSYKIIGVLTDQWSTEDNPQHVRDKEAVAAVLSEHINLSNEEIINYLNKDVAQVEFGAAGNNLSYHTVSNIKDDLESENLTGIFFDEQKKRLYPNGTFTSHTVGLAQYPQDDEDNTDRQLIGVMGLEASFNDLLTGENGYKTYKKDSMGYLIPSLDHEEVEPVNGNDLYLTLDHKLQVYLEEILDKVQSENTPKRITTTIMNPKNGEILASGQRPTFNATTLENIDDSWQNLLTEYTFEPGSTMKVLTLAAAIEEGVFDPNKYYESGSIDIYGGTVRDYNKSGWGWISYQEGLARSSNVLFVRLVDEMGLDVWKEYLDAFGFGEKTGITLPNEQIGNNPYKWPLQKVNTGFGQGIAVTPVQMLQAFSAVANKGEMVQPNIVSKTIDATTEEEKTQEEKVLDSPISEDSAQKALSYLKKAVEMEKSVAHGFQKEGYSIAAKTGTAQLVDEQTGLYSESKHISSVVAMIPAEDPEVLVYITIQEPKFTADAPTGSEVVQKIFHPLVDRIHDFTVDTDKAENDEDEIYYVQTPSYLGRESTDVINELDENGQEYALIGTGDEIVQQFPYPETPLFDDQQIVLMTNGASTMPDLTNWSRNDALKVAELTGSNMVFVGEGYVIDQDLPVDAYMEPGVEITITLSSEEPDADE